MKKSLARFSMFLCVTLAACTNSEDINSAYQKGQAFESQGNYAEALRVLRPIAEKGFTPAMNLMGIMTKSGEGMPPDEQSAVNWFRRCAEKGDELCATNLGDMFMHDGISIKRDYKEAATWYRRAVEKNSSAIGLHNLGVMHQLGLGMPRDRQKALGLYIKSAEQCFGPALHALKEISKPESNNLSVKVVTEVGTVQEDFLPRIPQILERCSKSEAKRRSPYNVN